MLRIGYAASRSEAVGWGSSSRAEVDSPTRCRVTPTPTLPLSGGGSTPNSLPALIQIDRDAI
jgi:hypothetical protein